MHLQLWMDLEDRLVIAVKFTAHRFTGDLQIGCAAFLLRTWRRQPFGSTIIEQCVPARDPGFTFFLVLSFLYYLLRPMAIKSVQLQLQAPHSNIFGTFRYTPLPLTLLPYRLCGLSCDLNVCFEWFSESQLHFGKDRNRCKAFVKKS